MKESEARKKWCPFARCPSDGDEPITINRRYSGEPKPGCMCIASDCMAWQSQRVDGADGWCGLTNP